MPQIPKPKHPRKIPFRLFFGCLLVLCLVKHPLFAFKNNDRFNVLLCVHPAQLGALPRPNLMGGIDFMLDRKWSLSFAYGWQLGFWGADYNYPLHGNKKSIEFRYYGRITKVEEWKTKTYIGISALKVEEIKTSIYTNLLFSYILEPIHKKYDIKMLFLDIGSNQQFDRLNIDYGMSIGYRQVKRIFTPFDPQTNLSSQTDIDIVNHPTLRFTIKLSFLIFGPKFPSQRYGNRFNPIQKK
jgi:hypothetical protein